MPQTVPMGFEFETLRSDQPTRTLHGGDPPSSPILAQQVNDAFVTVLADIADLSSRLAVAEEEAASSAWKYIANGIDSGGAFSIDVTAGGKYTAGTFSMLRLHARFGLDAEGTIRLRINGQTGAHGMGYVVRNALGNVELQDHGSGLNQWVLAHGATALTNNLTCTIFHTDTTAAVNYQSTGSRMSSSDNSHRITEAWGYLGESRLVSSLEIRPFTTGINEISTMWWWLEGFKVPS